MPGVEQPPLKAQPLLRALVEAIDRGRIRMGEPRTFIAYSEALEWMGVPPRGRAGQQLQRNGLDELNEWTIQHEEVPKIAALLVDKRDRKPGRGFVRSHGRENDPNWESWWMAEANRSIRYDWKPFLLPMEGFASDEPVNEDAGKVQEDEGPNSDRGASVVSTPPPARIRHTRITVGEILRWLSLGKTSEQIIRANPVLTPEDIRAALAYAAQRELRTARRPPPIKFTEKWGGKLRLSARDPSDPRLTYLLDKYDRLGQ